MDADPAHTRADPRRPTDHLTEGASEAAEADEDGEVVASGQPLMATARTIVSAEQESRPVRFLAGQTFHGPTVTITADYDTGDEDSALRILAVLTAEVVEKINAARPVAASTPQEGTTP